MISLGPSWFSPSLVSVDMEITLFGDSNDDRSDDSSDFDWDDAHYQPGIVVYEDENGDEVFSRGY
jgi:hypothetical protein